MLAISIYLAKIIGTNMVVLSLLIMFNPERMRRAMDAIFENQGLRFLFAMLTVIVGTILINLHNIWDLDWPIVITIIAWIVFLRGILRLYFPHTMRQFTQRFAHKYTYIFSGVGAFIIGAFLLYEGIFY